MIDFALQMVVSNAVICLGLALIALIVGRTFKRPSITHMIWLLVLVKMLTPPVVNISTFPVPWMTATDSPVAFETDMRTTQQDMGNAFLPASPERDDSGTAIQWKQLLFLAWLLGSGIIFAWSLSQVYRFHRLLKKESEPSNPEIYKMAVETASCMSLRKIPEIRLASARMSPMVWWIGGRVKIVVPDVLLERMESQELRWILAHEMAHVRRRDFCVRWVEWLTCVLFWWNPVAWWARRNLRINEELCCDELVLSHLKPQPSTYGKSLLNAVEILSGGKNSKPVLASGINSGEQLKIRIRILLSNKWKASRLRWVQAFILLGALIILPLGLTSAQIRNKDIVQTPLAEDGSDILSAIPDEMRAVSIRVDKIIGADSILPGTRVDVIRKDLPPNGNKLDDSRIVLENIQVLAFGQRPGLNFRDQSQNIKVAILLVTPEQLRKLVLAGTESIQLKVCNPPDREDSAELKPNLLPKQGSNNPTFVPIPKRGSSSLPPIPVIRQDSNDRPSVIPDGMRAVSIKFDSIIGDADSVLPGTRVDVIRKDLPPNGSKSGDSGIVLENVQVLTSGQYVEPYSDGQSQSVRVVTLRVTPEQAQKLIFAGTDNIQLKVYN